jgi:predicted nucleic acid-binding protein
MTDRLEEDAGRPCTGVADASVFIAAEPRRPLAVATPERLSVSVVTIGELRLGVLAATDGSTRAQRLETLSAVEQLDPLPIDAPVAHAWAALRVALRDSGKRMPINDSWIAATALAHRMPVVAQDSDYDGIPGLEVIRV